MDDQENFQWLEREVAPGLRLWHVIGIVMFSILSFIVLLCCCFRFRIPRTKQEIEADYQRRKIVRKFKKRIQKFENSEMDAEMDLKKAALEKIRAEFIQNNNNTKLKDDSSESNDESHYEESNKKSGKEKKRLLSVPKRDQLIQTIYNNGHHSTSPPSPVNHYSSLESAGAP